jgi:hypothetical protein
VIQLIANPEKYDNQRVRVIGFLRLEFEGNAIYLHREDFNYGISKNALWIDVPKNMTKEQTAAVNNKYVICTGRFKAGMHGHVGMFSGKLTEITRLESWADRPRHASLVSVPAAPQPQDR